MFWDEFVSANWEHKGPVVLLFIILLIMLFACVRDCRSSKQQESFDPQRMTEPQAPPPKITVTDGKTGVERVIQE
ncbi:unnamed protein product [Caenorhabditis auriculariae]|uniref:Uncharacterized protein n=1 Tax=Caenorhabditis auriculariae TaxID=2777116 RepID=A0A8S1HKB8_9PELO|nr:unnamed protein product [Caenorhabditis auriculariae]